MLIGMLEQKLGVDNLAQYIEEEKMISPRGWEEEMDVYKGATFNLGHQLTQMLTFRPHNKFEELDHCWLVGGGTHPGSGLPIILESARITANGILRKEKMTEFAVKPLPKVELFDPKMPKGHGNGIDVVQI
ncbi:All-trans-zeta-carotene desaturase [Lysinibacillus sphaericus]|uniref:All-trans-zeta-carotene desaturase n=2 Tax=Lysinibacillus sphaericus TaxID=1421 RepID=A0A2S5D2X3_LYSSH|nr:All-trans-zeta-carotene desaturase [Lysinibacillus sphaericus]